MQDNKNCLELNKLFYDKKSVKSSISAFQDVCEISYEEKDKKYIVCFDNADNNVVMEFQNYVLGTAKSNRAGISNIKEIQKTPEKEEQTKTLDANFGILPYFVKRIGKKYLIASRLGGWCLLTKEELLKLSKLNPLSSDNDKELLSKLKESHMIIDNSNALEIIKAFRRLNKNLFFGPSLHIVSLTTRCNLNCVYCHAGSPSNENIDLTREIALKIIEKIFESPNKEIIVEFQGGEPLLNWDVLKFFIEYIKKINKMEKKIIKFSITTNLSLLDEDKMKFLIDNKVKLCCSLDGPEKIHDTNRLTASGQGTYKKLVERVDMINKEYAKRDAKEQLNALVTFTRNSLPYYKEIIDEYVKLGFKALHLRYLNYSGLSKENWKKIGYSAEEFLNYWKKSIDHLLKLNEKGIHIVERGMLVLLKKIMKKEDAMYTELMNPCGGGRCQVVYTEKGDVLTCDDARSIEEDIFLMGNVMQDSYKQIMASPVLLNIVQASLLDIFAPNDIFNAWNGICPVENWNMQKNVVAKLCSSLRYKIHRGQIEYLFELIQDPKKNEIFIKWVSS